MTISESVARPQGLRHTTQVVKLAVIATATVAATISLAAPANADSVVNLPVTDAVRAELVTAGAAQEPNDVPASEFSGLDPGRTYYAYDQDHQTYWAAAGLEPISPRAKAADQDAGSYFIFHKAAGGPWSAYFDGYGLMTDQGCPGGLPPAVQSLWQWTPGACGPPLQP